MRIIYKIAAGFSALVMATQAFAIDVEKMTSACVNQGEISAVCKCSATIFAQTISGKEQGDANILVGMMSNKSPPSPSVMSKIAPLLQRYQQIGMECAMNPDVSDEEEDNSGSIGDLLPKGLLSGDELSDLDAIMSGEGDVMGNLKSLDAKNEQKRNDERQARKAQASEKEAEVASLREKVKAERYRLEQTPILDKSVDDFEKLLRMRTELYGDESDIADCLWSTLKQEAGNDKAGVLTAYFVATGGADGDQVPEHKPYMDSAYQKYQSYMSARDSCYEF